MNTSKMIILVGLIMSLALVTSSMTKTKDPAPQRESEPAHVIMNRADLQRDTRLTAWFEQPHSGDLYDRNRRRYLRSIMCWRKAYRRVRAKT